MTRDASHLRLFRPADDAANPPDSAPNCDASPGSEPAGVPLDRPLANDLEVVLSAWHSATERLRRTHEVLCDEVRRLTHELEAKNRELVRKNRLADLGQMASHIAHEVRNGLAPVTLYLSLLRRRMANDSDGLRILTKLESGFASLEATVHDMLSFTSDRQPVWRRFVVRDLIAEVCDSLTAQLHAHGLTTRLEVGATDTVWGDRDMLRRALVNLMLNAVDVMPQGGEICITLAPYRGGFELEVADNGPGVPPDTASRIFEPFFTTKADGAGLGLAIVYRVAEAHGGSVRVANCPEGGAAFTLRIPHHQLREAA
jgi:signal transduction histidine kinase